MCNQTPAASTELRAENMRDTMTRSAEPNLQPDGTNTDRSRPSDEPRRGLSGLPRAGVSGAVGAGTVTLLNEVGRRIVAHAPRMDVIGERALAAGMRSAGLRSPRRSALYRWSMAGDLASNMLYYGLVGVPLGKRPWLRGAVLGLAAGLGAAFLPGPIGLGRQPGARPPVTQLLTVAWYTAAGLAAGATYQALDPGRDGSAGD